MIFSEKSLSTHLSVCLSVHLYVHPVQKITETENFEDEIVRYTASVKRYIQSYAGKAKLTHFQYPTFRHASDWSCFLITGNICVICKAILDYLHSNWTILETHLKFWCQRLRACTLRSSRMLKLDWFDLNQVAFHPLDVKLWALDWVTFQALNTEISSLV